MKEGKIIYKYWINKKRRIDNKIYVLTLIDLKTNDVVYKRKSLKLSEREERILAKIQGYKLKKN